ncbi:EamA family transporter [Paracidovorax avenae]|nr:EamA family transporter [Paracidovorax avenae]
MPAGRFDNPVMEKRHRATGIGLVAIVLWASIVGLIRGVSEGLGAMGGAAMIYSTAAALLWATVGFTPLRAFPRRYLAWGSVLFVGYELCLSLSIGHARSRQQAIEVGMVNYLWPTFTMLAAIAFNGQRASWLVAPGLAVSLAGICTVLGGGNGVSLPGMAANIQDNPLSYGLAFTGAVVWAAYCTVTARLARGTNGITLFFLLAALVLWAQYLAGGAPAMHWSVPTAVQLAFAAAAMGFGCAAWNVGILHGHVTVLAGASYFTPVLSAALAALLLRVPLSAAFWAGACMVCGGAVLCWLATRGRPRAPGPEAC